MHFERSPMYQIHVLEDLLALLDLLPDAAIQACLKSACRKMAEPVCWLRHPSGQFPLFNDAAHNGVRSPADILEELRLRNLYTETDVPQGLKRLADAGLVIWHGNPWTVFFDVGPVGPDYQPGHAHADTLSLETSFAGVPLVVDPGTFCYDNDADRQYDRSTAAHNTVCIDDTDSSEVWHIFRVGRRGYPCGVSIAENEDGFTASASHNGYEHLRGSPRHRRHITISNHGRMTICDEIGGEGRRRAEGGFLLAPEWHATITPTGWKLNHASQRLSVAIYPSQSVELNIVRRPWHPEFGKAIATQRLVWIGNVTLPFRLETTWQRT
jgi:uncharacterized heparinase superfamily protein